MNCIICGNILVGTQTRFCCRKCASRARSKIYKPTIEKICKQCGKLFYVYSYRKDTAKYCSSACGNKATAFNEHKLGILRITSIGNTNAKSKITKPIRLCEVCNTVLNRHQKRFCSNKCACLVLTKDIERNKKIGICNKGKHLSEQQKLNISKSNTGKVRTKEQREATRKLTIYQMQHKQVSLLRVSKVEKAFGEALENTYNIKLHKSYWLARKCFDFKFGGYLIESDGTYWHSTPEQLANDKLKEEIADRYGLTLIRIKLDKIRQIPAVLLDNKEVFDNIFIGQKNAS
jgi:hypothetical protein